MACGITSLGLDHCNVLGETQEEIAWHKAGIMKPDCAAFTLKNESASVMAVLRKRAEEKSVPLCLVPVMSEYTDLDSKKIKLGLRGHVQYINSSLALQIARYWIHKMKYGSRTSYECVKENTEEMDESGLPMLKPVVIEESFRKGNECIISRDYSAVNLEVFCL